MGATVASLGITDPPWRSQRYYDYHCSYGGVQTTVALIAARIYAVPVVVPEPRAVDRIGVNITVAAAAGNKARLMLFSHTLTDELPGTLLLDAGEIAIDATGVVQATIATTLPSGLIYAAIWPQAAITVTGYTNLRSINGLTALNSSVAPVPYQDLTYGAAPAAFALTDYGTLVPRVGIRAT